MSRHLDRIMREAIAEGLVAHAALPSPPDERPWSVVAFTAFAAWLSAVPLLGVVLGLGFLVGLEKAMGLLIGVPLLVASVLVLRARSVSLFVEQLGVPGVLVGAGLIGFQAVMLDAPTSVVLGVLLVVAGVVAVLVPRAWMRTLMGAAIGVLAASMLLLSTRGSLDLAISPHLPWSLVACGWLLLQVVQRSIVLDARSAPHVAGLEAVSSGIAAAALAGAIWSSPTFLLSGVFGSLSGGLGLNGNDSETMRGLALLMALGGGIWLANGWPALRTAPCTAMLGVCALLTWYLPALGTAWLILFVCVESKRYALASFAGIAAVWLIGGLYYDFTWPLAYKALLLCGAGIVLALMGRYAFAPHAPLAEPQVEPQTRPVPLDRRTRVGFLLCALLVLSIANAAIWDKENLIQSGTAVFVELAPADPRSLMQGDYMRLRFHMPGDASSDGNQRLFIPQVVARRDERGVARLLRYHDGNALAQGEFLIDLVRKDNNWILVTDAWHFREGEAERWSKARYGEFRVRPDGKALLVGLRGPTLERL
jgi:uncharacterized membrane-anchored protein